MVTLAKHPFPSSGQGLDRISHDRINRCLPGENSGAAEPTSVVGERQQCALRSGFVLFNDTVLEHRSSFNCIELTAL